MNEALQAAYEYFTEQGYNGSIEEFVGLLNTNSEALDATYTVFTEQGYAGSAADFSGYLGLKKKDETEIDMVSELETGTSQPSALSRNQRLNVSAGPEKDTAIERAFGKNEVTDFFGDIYRAWKTGAGQGATVDDAIKVFASGSNVSDENLQEYIDAVQNMESFAPSEEMQDFSRIYEAEGKGIKGFIKGIAKNPTAAIQVATSSLRAMLNPASIGAGAAGAGAGALAGPAGAGAGAILGMTGALETGLSFTEFLKEELNEKSLDFTDDNIRTILEDDEAMGNITRRSLARGATISTISALTGGLAAGVGANVGRNVALKLGTQAGRAASGVAGLGVQAVGGGAGEAIGRAAAGQEMDVAEIGFEAIGEIASPSLIGTITAVAKVPKYKVNTEEVSEDFVKDIIGKSKNYLELDNIDIEIIDNPVLEAEVQKRKKELLDIENYKKGMSPQQLANATEEDIIELVSLQNELTKYNESGNEAGKDNAANKKAQIINKLNALQEPSTEKVDVQEPAPDSETVGEGDTEQQQPSTEAPSEQAETPAQPAEEVATQVETEESEVETYTLPEDPRKAKKDFQIIDNRDGFIEELDDDGSNKWILRNIKTDFYGTATTKTEAQQFLNNTVNREGRTMDYGEGQPILEEFRTQVEEEVVEDILPATNKIGNFDVVIKNNKIISITKDGKKPSNRSLSRVQKKILDQGLINVEEGEKITPEGGQIFSESIPFQNVVDFSIEVSTKSNNPKEVAQQIERVQDERREQKQTSADTSLNPLGVLFSIKFTPESYESVTGNKLINTSPQFRKTWIATKDKGGESLEDGWQVIFEEANLPVPATEDVTDFINEFETRAEFNRSLEVFTPELLKDLKNRFEELTGLNASPINIQRVIDASPETTQRIAEEEAVDVNVKEEKQKEQAQKKLTKKEISDAKKEAVEKERKKTIDNRNRKNALGNIKKGKLGTEETTVVLKNIFTIQPKIIRAAIKEGVLPAEILTRYNELAKLIGQRKAVLRDLPEVREIKKKADALYNELIDGINKEIEEAGEAEVEEVDVEKLKSDILSMPVKINTGLDKASRDLATKIKRLSDADLDLLIEETEDGSQDIRKLNQLELIKKNINAGFVPAAANDIINTIETRKDTKSLTPKFEKISTKGLQGGLRKSFFNIGRALGLIKTGNFFEAVFKSNPKTVFDDLMGNANDTTIFEMLIRPLAAAFSQYDVQRSNVLKESIEKIEKLIAFDGNKRIERSQNEIIKDKMKIMTYLLQLEHESNPIESNQEQNLTPPALAFIEETINYYIENSPAEADVTVEMLQEIKKEFTVNGKIDLGKLKNSFSTNINKAVDEYRKAFDNLADKTDFVSAVLRRNKVNLFNNYVKHVVLYNPSDKEAVYNAQRDKFTQKASAKSGSIEERIPGAKALSFDPSYALMKATDDILLDFNMTNEIRKFRMKINSLKKTEGLTPLQQQAVIALERSMEKALASTFDSINSDPSATTTLINEIRRIGYEAALVSAPRAVAELSSNFLFAISANPDATLDGIKNYGGVAKENGTMLNFLSNIGSTEATKLANVDEITGKLTDDLGVDKYVSKSGKAAPQLKSILLQINNYGPKQLRNFTADLSNKILSYPDQMIGRPLYLGEFVRVFEQETGIRLTEDDIREMAEGPGESKYLSQEYAEAINKAAIAADKQAIMSTTSRNPILAIEKFKRKKDAGAFQEIYREANAFMSNFFAFEYTTARTAVNALFNQGAISNKQALGLLLGITMRMSMYQIIYKVLSDNVDQAFREKDEDDIDETQEIVDETARSLTGSILTLLTRQTMGNVPFAAIAYGLERFNENNLGILRSDEEYDAFKHSIVYSQLGKKDLESENLMTNLATLFAGPYGTILRRSERALELTQRTQTRKTESARQEAQDELNRNIILDISGNAGLLPFYKDVRRIINAKRNKEYKEKQGAMSKSELRKLNPKLYKKLYGPGSADARLRALKRKLKSN